MLIVHIYVLHAFYLSKGKSSVSLNGSIQNVYRTLLVIPKENSNHLMNMNKAQVGWGWATHWVKALNSSR